MRLGGAPAATAPPPLLALARQLAPPPLLSCPPSRHSTSHSTLDLQNTVQHSPPRSLEFQRQPEAELREEAERGLAVRALLTLGGYYSKESRHMRSAGRLYAAVGEQAANPAFLAGGFGLGWGRAGYGGVWCCWVEGTLLVNSMRSAAPSPNCLSLSCSLPAVMGIPPGFQQMHSSLCLHIWLLLVRLRAEGKDGKQLAQVRCCSTAECCGLAVIVAAVASRAAVLTGAPPHLPCFYPPPPLCTRSSSTTTSRQTWRTARAPRACACAWPSS